MPIKNRIVTIGDSLADRGDMEARELAGFIPMSFLSGLSGTSPRGRFTNGFLWGDYLVTILAEQFLVDRVRKKTHTSNTALENSDLADAIITNEYRIRARNEEAFCLDNYGHVTYDGERFARFYCEGGLTAHDYSDEIILSPAEQVSREILTNLDKKREELLEDDRKLNILVTEKQKTLVVEWSGANDLITVNVKPTRKEAEKAVAARISNIEAMIANGYTDFVLFNLPDLSLTPRFQAKSKKEQSKAAECCDYFNKLLAEKCEELNQKYQYLQTDISIHVFDVCNLLREVHANPEAYGFDRNKLTQPYTKSKEFKKNQKSKASQKNHTSPSEGYMFWDDVHPTMDMHNWLAIKFFDRFKTIYQFKAPNLTTSRFSPEENAWLETLDLEMPRPQCPPLPLAILEEINLISSSADKMCRSNNPVRLRKATILKELVDNIEQQQGDLEKIHGLVMRFKDDKNNRWELITKHRHPVLDFFAHRKTTRSEEHVDDLLNAVEAAIQNSDSLLMVN